MHRRQKHALLQSTTPSACTLKNKTRDAATKAEKHRCLQNVWLLRFGFLRPCLSQGISTASVHIIIFCEGGRETELCGQKTSYASGVSELWVEHCFESAVP